MPLGVTRWATTQVAVMKETGSPGVAENLYCPPKMYHEKYVMSRETFKLPIGFSADIFFEITGSPHRMLASSVVLDDYVGAKICLTHQGLVYLFLPIFEKIISSGAKAQVFLFFFGSL